MPTTTSDLWAVWKYDQFPFYLCEEVDRIDADGYVRAKGYRGNRFKAVTLLHGERGQKLKDYLTAARNQHRAIKEAAETAMREALATHLTELGVPCAHGRVRRSGMQYPAIGKMFETACADVLSGDAPNFPWTPDPDQIISPKIQDLSPEDAIPRKLDSLLKHLGL